MRKRKKTGRVFQKFQIMIISGYFFPKIFSVQNTIRVCLQNQHSGNDLGLDLLRTNGTMLPLDLGSHSPCSRIFLRKSEFVFQAEKNASPRLSVCRTESSPSLSTWHHHPCSLFLLMASASFLPPSLKISPLSLLLSLPPMPPWSPTYLLSILPSYHLSRLSPPLFSLLLP